MVKIPSLDDLKKAGADLMGQAKSGNYAGMVDKIKSSIDSVTVNKVGINTVADETVRSQLDAVQMSLDELNTIQSHYATTLRNLQNQLSALTKTVVVSQVTPADTISTVPTDGENKSS